MAAPVNVTQPVVVTSVSDGGATETLVITSNPCFPDTPQNTVTITGYINIAPGTAGVAVILKCRRGTTTSGTQVGSSVNSIAVATDKLTIPFVFTDQPGPSHGLQYSITVTETSASGDGTVEVATIYTIVAQAT